MTRVAVIVLYFGKWPECLPLYLQGLRRNPSLEVLLFTDLPRPNDCPDNLKILPITITEIETRLRETTGLHCKITTPYRLCELRPTFGEMFADELSAFEFWGFGDIDVFYGNLKNFLTPDLLSSGDVISGNPHWISGPLSFFRNTRSINTLYRRAPDCQEILQSPKYLGFDECAFQFKQFRSGLSWQEVKFPRSNLTQLVREAESRGELRAHFGNWHSEHLARYVPSNFVIHSTEQGLFDNQNNEYALHHFKGRLHQRPLRFPKDPPAEFYLDETGFYSKLQFTQPFRSAIRLQRNIKLTTQLGLQKATRVVNRIADNWKASRTSEVTS
jgi:hypothetical protein